jgi:hypothetical protein
VEAASAINLLGREYRFRERILDWIAKRIQRASEAARVGAEIAARLEQELGGPMRERALRGAELAELADELIAKTVPESGEGS